MIQQSLAAFVLAAGIGIIAMTGGRLPARQLLLLCRISPGADVQLYLSRGSICLRHVRRLVGFNRVRNCRRLWYELPGNAWDYLAVTGNIYFASVFTLLVAGLYWRRATTQGAYAAMVLGAIGPITFLIVNLGVMKARQLGAQPPAEPSLVQNWLLQFSQSFPNAKEIKPELAGASSFALAFLGMIVGSLLSPRPRSNTVAAPR